MPQFDETATQVVSRLEALLFETDDVSASLDTAQQKITEELTQIETEWAELEQLNSSLLSQIDIHNQELTAATDPVNQSLEQLTSRIQSLKTETEQGLAETQSTIAAFSDVLESLAPEVETHLTEFIETVNHLRERATALEKEFTETLTENEEYLLKDIVDDVQDHKSTIEQRAVDLADYLTQDLLPKLTSQVTDFSEQLEDVMSQLTEQVHKSEEKLEKSAQETLEETNSQQTQQIDEIIGNGKNLTEAIADISEFLGSLTDTTVTAQETLSDGAKLVSIGLETALDVLEEAQELLSKFGIH
jgi:ABC-type transporter Mla subunit MlaD